MALPASGPISMSMVNTELGIPATTVITLNDAAVRTLFGISSGAIAMSDGYGKSYGVAYSYEGVIDTLGYRAYGAYFDGLGQSTQVTCESHYGGSSVCFGDDGYEIPNVGYHYKVDPAISSSLFGNDNLAGYYDPSTNSGFVSFEANGDQPQSAFDDFCDCPANLTTAYDAVGGVYNTQIYLGIKKNGTLWSWGYNSFGAVGDGTTTNRSSPIQIGSGTNWASVTAGLYNKFAIKTDGTLWAWGYNAFGQLGDNTTTNRSSPVQIGTGTNWATVSSMTWGVHAIKTDGTLWAWGANGYYGALGDGTTANRSSPVQIGTGTNWASVSSGWYNAFAIKTDGTLWGWGYGYYGAIGNGIATADCSSPVQIGTGTNWASVAGGATSGHAIKTDGTLWGWGYFYVGHPSLTNSSSPVQIGSSTNNKILAKIQFDYILYNGALRYPVINTSGNVIGFTGAATTVTSPVIYSGGGATKLISLDSERTNLWLMKSATFTVVPTQKAIFGYGYNGSNLSMTNLVSNTGVVSTDTTGVGTARIGLAAAGYGTDKAIFGYGYNGNITYYSLTNLVSNAGVVSTDTTGVGTARYDLAAAGYGSDKAIFGYGRTSNYSSLTNLVSNTGVVATDTTGVGTERHRLAAACYGGNKAIFGYGALGGYTSLTNLVSDTGVVSTDTTGVGTNRYGLAAASYGGIKAIFGYGSPNNSAAMTNLVSNTGVVASDTTGVGYARTYLAAASYGADKAIFGYGRNDYYVLTVSTTNLVSNTGVVSTDTTGVGTARYLLAAAGYSSTS